MHKPLPKKCKIQGLFTAYPTEESSDKAAPKDAMAYYCHCKHMRLTDSFTFAPEWSESMPRKLG